jgi:hypothetical protein
MSSIIRRATYLYKLINSGEHLSTADNEWLRRANALIWRCARRSGALD